MEERIKVISLNGYVELDVTLKDLKEQAGDPKDFDHLILEIASPGGNVTEGLFIMMWLDELSSLGIEITTMVVANAYSIASLIMLSANNRLISNYGQVMVHNPMIPELKYANADNLESQAKELRLLETMMQDIYMAFTGLDRSVIKSLMDEETYISPIEAVELGFADETVEIKKRSYEMVANVKLDIDMSKFSNAMRRAMAMLEGSSVVNQLYYTQDGEIEIFQEDASTYKIGDKTSQEEGEVTLSDGTKLIIKDSKIEEIEKGVEVKEDEEPAAEETKDGEEDKPEGEELKKIVEEATKEEVKEEEPAAEKSKDAMPAKVIEKTESTVTTKETVAAEIKEVSKWEINVVNESFEIGDKIEYKPLEEGGDPYSVGAGEYELEDGSKILTDSEGIIRYKTEATPASNEAKKEVKEEEKVEAFNEGPAPKNDEEMIEKIASLEKTVEALAGQVEAMAAKVKETEEFQSLTSQAVVKIAENTTSGFKPEARSIATVEPASGKSLFQTLNARAQAARASKK